jgi:transcriptional regulator NrdR family protein
MTMGWRETTVKLVKDILRQRTIREVIAKELKESHLRKLEAESAVEYARSIVIYNEQRIKRLQERLTEHTEEGDYT